MPTAAAISAGGAIAGSGISAIGSLIGSNQQVGQEKNALNVLQSMFGTVRGAAQPLIDLGLGGATNALSTLQKLLTPGPNQTATLSQIPGFQFAQDWGQKAVQNLGTTTGLGGNTLAGGAQYATGLAQNSFGNIATLLENLFGQSGNLATGGVNALSSAAQGIGGQIANTTTQLGQSQAAGTLGATNALSGGLTSAGNTYLLSSLFGKINPGAAASSGGVYGGASAVPYTGTPYSAG